MPSSWLYQNRRGCGMRRETDQKILTPASLTTNEVPSAGLDRLSFLSSTNVQNSFRNRVANARGSLSRRKHNSVFPSRAGEQAVSDPFQQSSREQGRMRSGMSRHTWVCFFAMLVL